ncbi:MAG: hypothetical protein FJ190_09965 [Gammaproteobacteria bacterium]|nr:hypothetical protein [Gammaproteobacteria bacterium]
MPLFVIFCLIFAFVVQTGSPVEALLSSELALYGGLTVTVLTIIASFLHRIPEAYAYDLFASSALFVWFSYWKPFFVKDSPIFFFFPVYFALLVAFTTLFFIGQRHKIDRQSLQLMQRLASSGVIDPWMIMTLVLITLYFENRFIQYPTCTTLLIMRYALYGCLKPSPKASYS